MPTFTPPTQTGAPYAWPDSPPAARALYRHYGTQTEGRNVYILTDGTVTETDPSDWSTVAHALWGGHIEPVTTAEATLLTANGYGAYLTTPDEFLLMGGSDRLRIENNDVLRITASG